MGGEPNTLRIGMVKAFVITVIAVVAGVTSCSIFTELNGLADDGPNRAPDAGEGGTATDGSSGELPQDGAANDGASSDGDGGDIAPASCGPGPLNGLVAYYNFDENTGDTVHDCLKRYDGTIMKRATDTWA